MKHFNALKCTFLGEGFVKGNSFTFSDTEASTF